MLVKAPSNCLDTYIMSGEIMSLTNRRNTHRATITVPVVEEFHSVEQEVRAINISEHGMRYQKPKGAVLCQGKEVFLTFSLFDRLKPIKVLGWVLKEIENDGHIDTHVTFMFLPTRDEEMIRDFVTVNGMNMVH